MRRIAFLQLLLVVLVSPLISVMSGVAYADSNGTAPLMYLPVQDAGRVKPFDTFARETLQLVYGSDEFRSPSGERRRALEIIMTWMLLPQYWDQQPIVMINHKGLKDSLKLEAEKKYFSPSELLANPRLALVMQEMNSFRATKQKMTPYFQAASQLENQIGTYQAVKVGQALRVVPPQNEPALPAGHTAVGAPPVESEKWVAVAELQGELQEKFGRVIKGLVQTLPASEQTPKGEQTGADATAGTASLAVAVEEFKAAARAANPALYPSERDISIEVHERTLHPFKVTWILYLLAAIALAVSWHLGGEQGASRIAYRTGWALAGIAFLMHTYGFGLRCYITGRPPVSNMYESVVWVSWGVMGLGMILEAVYRRRFILLAGAVVGILCLIIADLAPSILDRSLQPLEPVLRSNMWLTVHVLTITLSYSAFFLAWGLGNIGLAYSIRGFKPTDERIRAIVLAIYRSMQVGVVLLAAGIILGGIWADYSWGRFWGWDPKETWALIALLGYIAALHGRLAGLIQNVGMMVSAIVAFNLVIMAWYGVNFVLGAGLHTYGMGAGGVQYVGAFVILNLIYVGYAAYISRAREQVRENVN